MQSPRVVDSPLLIYVYLITFIVRAWRALKRWFVIWTHLFWWWDDIIWLVNWTGVMIICSGSAQDAARTCCLFFFWCPFLHACSWPRWFLDTTSISIIGLVSPKYQVVLAHHNPSRLRTTFPLKLSLNTHQKIICLLKTPLVSTRTVTLKSYIDDVFISFIVSSFFCILRFLALGVVYTNFFYDKVVARDPAFRFDWVSSLVIILPTFHAHHEKSN